QVTLARWPAWAQSFRPAPMRGASQILGLKEVMPTKSPKPGPLEAGDKAPAFDLPAAGGGRVSLAALKGKRVVLYFYPKDDTPGCTTEALNFTEKAKDFAKAGAVVVGVSRDSAAKHDKFTAKYGLKVQLGADDEGAVTEAYGVWVEKKLYGRTYMG